MKLESRTKLPRLKPKPPRPRGPTLSRTTLKWRLPRRPKVRRLLATNTWALKDRSPTSSRTKPPRSAPTIIFFKNIDVETAEEDQVVRAVKTKQNAESELAINT